MGLANIILKAIMAEELEIEERKGDRRQRHDNSRNHKRTKNQRRSRKKRTAENGVSRTANHPLPW